MIRMAACAAAGVIFALSPFPAITAPAAPPPDMARVLIQGCLADPSSAATAQLATTVGAKPYSDASNRRALTQHDSFTVPDIRIPGEADRVESQVTAFQGWTLPRSAAGRLTYVEETIRKVKFDQASGQPIEAERVTRSRECTVNISVASGRAVFEAYEALHDANYGALITADRKHIVVFRFKPDAYDIELDIGLDAPLAGAPIGAEKEGSSRVVLSDGGPRFINGVMPGVAGVTLTRAALLAGLDRRATIGFANTVLEAVAPPQAASPPPVPKPAAGP